MKEKRPVGVQLIVIAALYMMAALVLGLVMGISGNHSLFSVHSHLGLLGWTTMALTGIVYVVLPGCGEGALARVHFWLHNLGLPIMVVALTVVTLGDSRGEPAVGLGSVIVALGLLAFTVNVIRQGGASGARRVAAGVTGERL
jgi:hypothetical protein